MSTEHVADCQNETDAELRILATASIPKLLTAYAVPSMLTLIALSSYELADRIIVGHASGDTELALLGVALPFVFWLEACCATVKVGTSCAMSRLLGKDDVTAATRVLGCALALALAFGVLIASIGTLFATPLALVCGATDDIVEGSATFIFYLSLGVPFYFVLFTVNSALKAQARPNMASGLVIFSSALNVVLDLVLVVGFGMGAKGAAVATALSQFAGAAVAMILICDSRRIVRFASRHLNLGLQYVKEILVTGLASAAFELSFTLYGLALNLMLSRFDDPSLIAANVTIASILLLVNAPMTGIAEAAQTLVAFNFGQNNRARVMQSVIWAWGAGSGLLLLVGVALYVFAEEATLVFVSGDPSFTELAAGALRYVVLLTPCMSSMLLVPEVLVAMGDARNSFLLNCVSLFALQIPLVLVLPHFWGATGVWLSFPVYDALSTGLCLVVFWIAANKLFKNNQEVIS